MRRIEQKKLLTLIVPEELQRMTIETLSRRGIGGYTLVPATGAGAAGLRSGMLVNDANVVIYIILSEARLDAVLGDIEEMVERGYRIKALFQDISILPRKKE
jgi:nitrogen regulatory protein PII